MAQASFPEQLTTDLFAQNIMYAMGVVGTLLLVGALIIVGIGGVRSANILDNAAQKTAGFFIGFFCFLIVGYAVWSWQYYVAFGVDQPYWTAIKDWWLAGTLTSAPAQALDPLVAPGANNQQIFIFFLAAFAGLINVLLHYSVEERIKPAAYYIICAVMGLAVWPINCWLLWGSTSPITNLGFHDMFGVAIVYVPVGTMSLVLARRVGPRIGVFSPDERIQDRPHNLGLVTVGIVLILAAVTMILPASGFWFPKTGFYGVNFSDTGFGIIMNNLGAAFAGGTVMGAALAYRTKNVTYLLLGPLAGYAANAGALDVYDPWMALLVGLSSLIPVYFVYEWLQRKGIDDQKLVPLGLGAGIYGLILLGLIKWGTATSGYPGLTEGTYAFQNADITVYWQLLGVAVAVGIGFVTAQVLCFVLERTTGLRVSEEAEVMGGDATYWAPPEPDELPVPAPVAPGAAVGAR